MNKNILLLGLLILLLACISTGFVLALRQKAERKSLYVTMSDGVQIAIDVWLPAGLQPGEKIPTVMRSTPYWRSYDLAPVGKIMERLQLLPPDMQEGSKWTEAGYALVMVDVRGSGASFGQWEVIWSEREIADLGEILDWIVAQPWSNGNVGAYGVSYEGNTAELMAALQHPALKAAAPQYNDFDLYNVLVRPGGVLNRGFMEAWNQFHGGLVKNDVCALEAASGVPCAQMRYLMKGVRPVDVDSNGEMLTQAVDQHQELDVYQIARDIEYSDDTWADTGLTLGDLSPYSHKTAIENSHIPLYVWAGWLDSATVDGALGRYQTFSNPQKLLIGPWSHGGGHHIDPFLAAETAVTPSVEEQFQMLVDFFDLYLKDGGNPQPETGVTYYTLGEGTWKETQTWPPDGFTPQTWYFGPDGALSPTAPDAGAEADVYQVNWEASTGELSRWFTGLFKADVVYGDRAEADEKLLTYTSQPLETAVEITGSPIVVLHAASSTPDAAFHVYLEDVAPDGQVTYITEGILRGNQRQISTETPPYVRSGPYRTLARADAQPLVPGEVTELHIPLYATSVLIQQGHRLRIAIAGHDAAAFERIPHDATPTFSIQRSSVAPSHVILPMLER
ncbi:MAG: CocE/NonD family hydrolase [Chloroflexota bacterium]